MLTDNEFKYLNLLKSIVYLSNKEKEKVIYISSETYEDVLGKEITLKLSNEQIKNMEEKIKELEERLVG